MNFVSNLMGQSSAKNFIKEMAEERTRFQQIEIPPAASQPSEKKSSTRDSIPSHKSGKLIIEPYEIPTKKGSSSNWQESFKPSVLDLCHFANIAYEGTDETKSLKNDWKILAKAKNEEDGYHGVTLWNEEHEQLVIAHSGTNNFEGIKTDLKSVVLNVYSSQIHSSCEFALRLVNDFEKKRKFRIIFTGHSLGGYLAQISAFAVKYLTDDMKKTRTSPTYNPLVVTFDSPGCLEMLKKLYKDYFNYLEEEALSTINNFDITTYILAPNLVNCVTKHAGVLICYDFINFNHVWASEETKKKGLQLKDMFLPQTSNSHDINNFILALGKWIEERFVVTETSEWPLITKTEMLLASLTIAGSSLVGCEALLLIKPYWQLKKLGKK